MSCFLLFTSSQAWPCSPPPPGGISPFILQLLNDSLLDVDRLCWKLSPRFLAGGANCESRNLPPASVTWWLCRMSEPPGNSGDCLCRWWASAYRQPGVNCKGRLRRGRTDFSWVTIHHSVFIASGILRGMEKASARRYNHFSHRCFKQAEPREKTAASLKNLLRAASSYFCTPPVGRAH